MARALIFTIGGQTVSCGVDKVDRRKLYGFRRRQVLDEQNRACKLGLLCEDGHSLVGPGGVAMAYIDQEGDWVDRGQLVAVDDQGNPLPLIPSSYDGPIALTQQVTLDDAAALLVRDVLQLDGGPADSPLRTAIGEQIFRFVYSYRADYAGEEAYLMNTPDGLFALIGDRVEYHFVGLQSEAPVEAAGDAENDDDLGKDDDLDFGMM